MHEIAETTSSAFSGNFELINEICFYNNKMSFTPFHIVDNMLHENRSQVKVRQILAAHQTIDYLMLVQHALHLLPGETKSLKKLD